MSPVVCASCGNIASPPVFCSKCNDVVYSEIENNVRREVRREAIREVIKHLREQGTNLDAIIDRGVWAHHHTARLIWDIANSLEARFVE